MVTITVTCYAWALSSGDHLFTCGAISRRPQWVWALWHQTGAQYSAVECTRARVAIRRIVAPAPQQVASGARRVMSASCEVRPLIDLWAPVMESQDPFLRVSEVSGLVSVLRLWILQRNGLLKFLIQRVFFVVFAGKKQPQHVEKMPEIWKNSSQKWWWHFFEKIRQNAQILKSRVSVSNFKPRVSVSKF